MRVIIGGCGRVGSMLATRMAAEGHEIAVVDHDRRALSHLGRGFAGTTHKGKVFDRETLLQAGIEHADAFVAVTSGDNSNVVSAIVAREVFRVPQVVARIFDPRRAEIYRRLGIPAVSSVSWAANEIRALVGHAGLAEEAVFGDGEVRLVSVSVPAALDGMPVASMEKPGEISAIAIVSAGEARVPVGGESLKAGDLVYVSVAAGALDRLNRELAG